MSVVEEVSAVEKSKLAILRRRISPISMLQIWGSVLLTGSQQSSSSLLRLSVRFPQSDSLRMLAVFFKISAFDFCDFSGFNGKVSKLLCAFGYVHSGRLKRQNAGILVLSRLYPFNHISFPYNTTARATTAIKTHQHSDIGKREATIDYTSRSEQFQCFKGTTISLPARHFLYNYLPLQ